MKILIVDDERVARRALIRILVAMGDVSVREAGNIEEARRELATGDVDVVLIDVRLDRDGRNRDGLTLVGEVRSQTKAVPIVVTASHDMSEIRAAMRLGAYDYMLKDELSEDLVLPILEAVRAKRQLEREVLHLRARQGGGTPSGMVGTSTEMQWLREMIARVAVCDRPVLVTGATGSGKELAVSAIHALGPHPEAPLLDLNCGAFPAALIESQLFGHEQGAFTGADERHDGFFEAVGAGTLFLDEVAELPFELQAKLLRVLETRTFRPVGATANRRFAGRIIAATHVDLEERVASDRFREDLFYRLNVLEVRVPSLEERREDIPALVAHFAATQARPLAFTEDAMEWLKAARWPGNVRQLRNLVDRIGVFAPDGPVTGDVVIRFASRARAPQADLVLVELVRMVLRRNEPDKLAFVESALVEEALRLSDGNKTAAARLLGVHRKVVERRQVRDEPKSPTSSRNRDDTN